MNGSSAGSASGTPACSPGNSRSSDEAEIFRFGPGDGLDPVRAWAARLNRALADNGCRDRFTIALRQKPGAPRTGGVPFNVAAVWLSRPFAFGLAWDVNDLAPRWFYQTDRAHSAFATVCARMIANMDDFEKEFRRHGFHAKSLKKIGTDEPLLLDQIAQP